MKEILNFKREVSQTTIKRSMKEWEDTFQFDQIKIINQKNHYFNTSDYIVSKINEVRKEVMPTVEGIWVRQPEGYYSLIIKCPFCGEYHKHCRDEAVLFYNLKTKTMTNIVRVSHCKRDDGVYRIQANPNIIKCIPTKSYFELSN